MKKRIRIVCAEPQTAEDQVNELLDDYTPIVWNVQPGKEGPLVTAVLVSTAELQKQQRMAVLSTGGLKI